MVNAHYSVKEEQANTCRAKASSWRVHFKNTTETANAIRGLTAKRAMAYLKNVIVKKECVPFRKYKGGVGRCAQAKQFKTTQVGNEAEKFIYKRSIFKIIIDTQRNFVFCH